MTALAELHADIDDRVQQIRKDRPDWLCGKGCDGCCRQLADIPQLTSAEWALLREGLAGLSPESLEAIGKRIAVLGSSPSRPVTCPLLDLSTGACPVYLHRPVACRTYGFYIQRAQGLYCRDIETKVSDGFLSEVVWGNHYVVDRRLASFGQVRSLRDWFELDMVGGTSY